MTARRITVCAVGLVAALVAAVLTWTAVAPSPPAAQAVLGVTDPVARNWAAKITFPAYGQPEGGLCSGSLVAEQWVLTAAHCARTEIVDRGIGAGSGPLRYGAQRAPRELHVYLGGLWASDAGRSRAVDDVLALPVMWNPTSPGGYMNDLALLHLTEKAPSSLSPLPIRSSESVVPGGTAARFFGWGVTAPGTAGGQSLNATDPGDWTLSPKCSVPTASCYTASSQATSYPDSGDSGGIAASLVRGSWIQDSVFSGPGREAGQFTMRYGASMTQYANLIRAKTGNPFPRANTIVRDRASGASWTVDATGFRHWIPDGGTYLCLVGKGMTKIDMSRFQALSIPEDTGARATCTNGGTPPSNPTGPTNPTTPTGGTPSSWDNGPIFPVMNTSETPPDGVYFRYTTTMSAYQPQTGLGVYRGDRVRLKCYVINPDSPVGPYKNTVWYLADNVTRPKVSSTGEKNWGYLNAHYVDDGLLTNQVAPGVAKC